MKVRLFGKSNDDKGTQLERLTKCLLERLGYKQVTLNFIASGGSEVDIHAELPIPGLSGVQSVPLIGECKSHEAPITLPDWLKFLGKVFTERSCRRADTRALFVALGGANGNVDGAFAELRLHDPSVDLVMGDRLAKLISEEFKLPDIECLKTTLAQLSSDTVVESSIGYYNGIAFWIVEFSNSTFTILTGSNFQEKPGEDLIDLVTGNIQAAKYRDLFAENAARERHRIARKFVLGQLFIKKSLDPSEWTPMPIPIEPLTETEIDKALQELTIEQKVIDSKEGPSLPDLVTNPALRTIILKELVEGFFCLNYFATPEWNTLIDSVLLDESLRIKDDLAIPEGDRANLIRLMIWSPSALFWALMPDEMLCGHKDVPLTVLEKLRPDHARFYKLQLLRLAAADFRNPQLGSVLFEKHGLRELEFIRKAVFKSEKQIELDMEVAERARIAYWDPKLGGGLVMVWLTETAPQPWDGLQPTTSQDEERTGPGFLDINSKESVHESGLIQDRDIGGISEVFSGQDDN